MAWLGGWIQSALGNWLGSSEPEAPGAMSAALRGSSVLSGNLEGQGVPSTADMSADLFGTGSMSATIPAERTSGGILGTIRRMWRAPARPVNISADLRGSGRLIPNIAANHSISAKLHGRSKVASNIGATVDAVASLQGNSNTTGSVNAVIAASATISGISSVSAGSSAIADISAVIDGNSGVYGRINGYIDPVIVAADMSVALSGVARMSANGVVLRSIEPAKADDEMMMLLLLAA